ncbi:MAG: transglycosylase SLT domain-containing protein [Deltaproteobacteria bacterium]|nr:transglycosylase SLT domain-containing protein [Deltaproteobacteria bacterium]
MPRTLATALVLALAAFLCSLPSPAPAQPPGLDFCGEKVPLGRPEVAESIDQELLLLSEARSRVWLTLRRTDRYLPIVEAALQAAKVPQDFKYLPLAVTNLSPVYRSGNRRGLWRLTEAEAGALGLSVTKEIDERLDPRASSLAAAGRLAGLHGAHKSWTMALAAFLEPASLSAAQAAAGGNSDYYSLYVPESLDKAVSLVLAGKVLYGDPGAYGYGRTTRWPNLAKNRRQLAAPADMRATAESLKLDVRTFRDMNPHVLGDVAPAGAWLNVP